ncbi:hypothetical protein CC1G_04945 [Coprinopsis cinerea okayama7|uniref:Uncharacterized protein n=1 Tax=Coprinopsis cinerea (strain Okayama-7 / 130 / ATCC MYA-4618 / FGSC 9003) TaxID=240176 RepID=A8PFN0_COPC7|nr:hypothetical protein CC1G_04945 [Coprinopsis cinerea okayama7\|eukprot:XP_001841101.2 hypothetical protein CC1G_04945 [Coprinopsis cinerea okayama7\
MGVPVARRIFLTVELLFQILEQVDWPTLIQMSRTSTLARFAAVAEGRRRVYLALSRFITKGQVLSFLTALKDSQGIVVGSVASTIPRYGAPSFERSDKLLLDSDDPYDLNIVVPAGRQAQFMDAMHQFGFKTWSRFPLRSNFRPYANAMYESARPVVEVFGGHARITLSPQLRILRKCVFSRTIAFTTYTQSHRHLDLHGKGQTVVLSIQAIVPLTPLFFEHPPTTLWPSLADIPAHLFGGSHGTMKE